MTKERQEGPMDRSWLVKSGDRILGPFTIDEVQESLRNKDVTSHDEIMAPMKRWRYIREEPQLARVLEELRKAQMAGREDTEVGTEINTEIHSATQPGGDRRRFGTTESDDFTLTPTPRSGPAAATEIPPSPPPPRSPSRQEPRSADATSAPPRATRPQAQKASSVSASAPAAPAAQASARTIDSGRDSFREQAKRRRALIFGGAAVALVAVAWIAWRQGVRVDSPSRPSASNAAQDGLRAYDLGRFDEAARRFSETDGADPNVALKHAAILARRGETLEAKRKIEPFLASADAGIRASARVAQGAALIAEHDLQGASAQFAEALKSAPGNAAALLNLAALAIKSGDAHGALERLKALPASAETDGLARFLKGRAEAEIDRSGKSGEQTWAALANAGGDFAQEARAAVAFASASRPAETGPALSEMLLAATVDPFQTELHWHDPAVPFASSVWSEWLSSSCDAATSDPRFAREFAALALRVVCKGRAGKVADAEGIASDMIRRGQHEAMAHAAKAYVLISQGAALTEQSMKLALDEAARLNNPQVTALAQALSGHACWRQGDWACAQRAFENAARATRSPTARAYAAFARFKQGAPAAEIRPEAQDLERTAPHLIPLRELKAALGSAP